MNIRSVFVLTTGWLLLACESRQPAAVELVKAPVVEAPPAPTPEAPPATDTEASKLKETLLGLNKPPAPQEPVVATIAASPAKKVKKKAVVEEAQDEPEPAASGGLSDFEFQSAVGGWKGVRACLDESSALFDDPTGALQIAFTIKEDGSVAGLKVVDASTPVAQKIAPCVEKRAKRIKFPAFAGSEEITRTAKFVF